MIWLSNLLTLRVPGEEYFRNLSCVLNWIVFQSFTTSNNSTKMILCFEFVFQLFCWSVCYFVRYITFIQNLVVNAGVFFLAFNWQGYQISEKEIFHQKHLAPRYNWNIVESVVKHHNRNPKPEKEKSCIVHVEHL